MDIQELGSRVRIIRENIFKMTQVELAAELDTTQGLLSRLEKGIGASIELVFRFMNFLEKKKYPSYLLFKNPFKYEDILEQKKNTSRSKTDDPMKDLAAVLSQLKDHAQKDYESIVLLNSLLKNP